MLSIGIRVGSRSARSRLGGLRPSLMHRGLLSTLAENVGDGVVLTERGAERIRALQKHKGDGELKLRLAVEGGGCSGFSYIFDMTSDAPGEDDVVFTHHGESVVVDSVSLDFVKGSTIDFTEDLIRRSFEVIDNPNAESGCGCGSSFAAKMEDF
mmetsp:Transcript_10701/g.17496  ORF Transcript_10701/g.17496 Transcript_10701/m.17496 type:complete len:154 (-) Transcript_10701:1332-1793(-)|eukprot:CAMPEP_0203755170 /NCGR_PEP_ID=MMETSP0098-20131031/8664_1 /ASSEMBLY_ACC=CAM_ASM_000208 /TAXON_ID=96639 /ORGANISM=" , Strain NY0313808BC1" /LENGTH=153 /DNA_ID=CAMNT_0050646515 /DNA_START=30 /DNA_END=491 /DNA_ORIENTATION=-